MKKAIIVLMLSTGIMGKLCAQQTASEKTFNQEENQTNRHFYIDLDNGNKMQVNLNDLADLDKFRDMDSLIYGFLQDMKLLKDSLGDQLTVRRIDYNMDNMEQRKIRIQRFPTKGSSFVLADGEVSALKTEQDTINFIGKVDYEAKYTLRKKFKTTRHYKLTFILNDISGLSGYMNGTLSKKIATIKQNADHGKWDDNGKGTVRLLADESIYAKARKGYAAGGDYISLGLPSVILQNYKNYFVPSLSIGFKLILASKNFKREIGLFWEPNFMFRTNSAGKLQTFRNDFINLTLSHGSIRDNDPRKESVFLTTLSFGYLKKQKGDFFEDRTFRIGAGKLSLFEGKTKIEPMIYFTDFFKQVSPGLRLIQSF